MSDTAPIIPTGRVASLHLHPKNADAGLETVEVIEVVANAGIRGDHRYFGRISRSTGKPGRRQVSLTEREQILGHAKKLGVGDFPPGAIRSNIETTGIDLISLVGAHVAIGEAILYFYEPRTPCSKMDALCEGLRALMEGSRQGVMAEVVRSGIIRVGDAIRPVASASDRPTTALAFIG